jgi:hypothetical protein
MKTIYELRKDTLSTWTREANSAADEQLYRVGKPVEIDYVIQEFKETS